MRRDVAKCALESPQHALSPVGDGDDMGTIMSPMCEKASGHVRPLTEIMIKDVPADLREYCMQEKRCFFACAGSENILTHVLETGIQYVAGRAVPFLCRCHGFCRRRPRYGFAGFGRLQYAVPVHRAQVLISGWRAQSLRVRFFIIGRVSACPGVLCTGRRGRGGRLCMRLTRDRRRRLRRRGQGAPRKRATKRRFGRYSRG